MSLRFANVYGPRQDAGLEGGVVAIFLERLARGEATMIFGDGRHSRDFVYVDDVVAALLAAVGHGGGPYNVGTGEDTTVARAARRVRTGRSEATPAPTFEAARLGDVQRSVLDSSLHRARARLARPGPARRRPRAHVGVDCRKPRRRSETRGAWTRRFLHPTH